MVSLLGTCCSWISESSGKQSVGYIISARIDGTVQTAPTCYDCNADQPWRQIQAVTVIPNGTLRQRYIPQSFRDAEDSINKEYKNDPNHNVFPLSSLVPQTANYTTGDAIRKVANGKPPYALFVTHLDTWVLKNEIQSDFEADYVERDMIGQSAVLYFYTREAAEKVLQWNFAVYKKRRIKVKWSKYSCLMRDSDNERRQ